MRLLCPALPQSQLSMVPEPVTNTDQLVRYVEELPSLMPAVNEAPAVEPAEAPTPAAESPEVPAFVPEMPEVQPPAVQKPPVDVSAVLCLVWILGMAAMGIYGLGSYWWVRQTVAASVELGDGVSICDYIDPPFLLGVWKPTIYLPSRLDGESIPYVLAHERAHIQRRDHWWKPLGYVLLSIHWFNPMIWLGYILLCRDIEMACDEAVIRSMDAEKKKQYSHALLTCSLPRPAVSICPQGFGEVGVKERIRNVLKYRRPALWLSALGIAAVVVGAVCFLTNPVSAESVVEPLPVIDYTYTPQLLAFSEKGVGYGVKRDMEVLETTAARYQFDTDLDETQRRACAEATEQLLLALGEFPEKPEITIFSPKHYDGLYLEGNHLYCGPRDWQSIDYAADVLLAVYGEFTHYGAAYGYAAVLCQRLGWIPEEMPAFTAPTVLETGDLNILCFSDRFTSPADVAAAKTMARGFTGYLLGHMSEERFRKLLDDSSTTEGMELLTNKLGTYYDLMDLFSYQPTTLRFGYGGSSMDYMVASDLARFCLEKEWEEVYRKELYPENFLHRDYPQVKAFFQLNLQQMQEYQKDLGQQAPNDGVLVVLENRVNYSRSSWYEPSEKTAHTASVMSLMGAWLDSQLYAPDFSYETGWPYYGLLRNLLWDHNAYCVSDFDAAISSFEGTAADIVRAIEAHEGRTFSTSTDWQIFDHLFANTSGFRHPSTNPANAGASFVGYLMELYGKDTIIDHFCGSKAPLPQSYEELIPQWQDYIQELAESYGL